MMNRRNLIVGISILVGGCTTRMPDRPGFDTGPTFPFWKNHYSSGADVSHFPQRPAERDVSWSSQETVGTIVVETASRLLYFVHAQGKALRYDIGVGREGSEFRGNAVVGRKAEWPGWRPTDEMIRRDPARYGPYRDGMQGGPGNPLGARALYLHRDGVDTLFRIHGTNQPSSIGTASSAGCIRMHDHDVIDLYGRVPVGAPVIVR